MIPYVNIKRINPNGFYDEYSLGEEEIQWLLDMADEGLEQEAIDTLIDQFFLPPGIKYEDVINKYLYSSQAGVLKSEDKNHMIRNIALLSAGLAILMKNNFSAYMKKIYAPKIFKRHGLEDSKTKKAILQQAITDFDEKITGVMANTQSFAVNGIRSMQREIVSRNLFFKEQKIKDEAFDVEKKLFDKGLRRKYPSIYKAIDEGNIVVTRKLEAGGESLRHYKINYYSDLLTRTSILNIDRNTVSVAAAVNGERVVGYRLADPRKVKKDREICQQILANKVYGVSLLAVDEDAARKLGIMTIEEAQSTPDYAMGPYCRHTIYRLGNDFLERINKDLEEAA